MNELIIYGFLVLVWCIYVLVNLKTVNATSIFSLLFLIMYGFSYINYQLESKNVEDDNIRTLTWLLILFVIFFNFGNKFLFLKTPQKYNFLAWNMMPVEPVFYQRRLIIIVSLVLMFIIFIGLFFFGGLSGLQYLSSSDYITPEQIDELRHQTGVQGPISGIYAYAITAIGRFFALIFFADALFRKNKIQIIFSVLFLALIMLALLANLSKSSAFICLLQIVVFFVVFKGIKINFKKILLFFGGFLALLIFIYIFVTGVDNTSVALDLIGNRIFGEPIRVLNLYTEYYPKYYPHTYGMNTRLIYLLFGEGEFVGADVKLSNYKGTVNSIFIADAWVDYSYVGVVIESFFLGVYMAMLDKFLFQRKNLVSIAVVSTIILSLLSLPSIPLLPSLITFGLLSVPILSVLLTKKIVY